MNVIPFSRPVAAQRADGVQAAVRITARRLGLDHESAIRQAASAKRAYLAGRGSPARIISEYTGAMRETAGKVSA